MKNALTEREILLEINSNIKKLLAVFAIQGKDDEKKMSILYSLGYSASEISELSGIPPGTVRGKWSKISKKK